MKSMDGDSEKKSQSTSLTPLFHVCAFQFALTLMSGGGEIDLRVEATSHICTSTGVCCFYVANGVRHDAHAYS